jgi:F-type H+-transporting ATPase subunit alpha
MPVGEQIAILYCGVHGLMHDVAVDQVRTCQDQFLEQMRSQHQDVIDTLASGKIDDDCTKVIEEVMSNITGQFAK